jgi:hypothetical protein
VQHWTSETVDIPADYVLDWSNEFDRNTRLVPTEDSGTIDCCQNSRRSEARSPVSVESD